MAKKHIDTLNIRSCVSPELLNDSSALIKSYNHIIKDEIEKKYGDRKDLTYEIGEPVKIEDIYEEDLRAAAHPKRYRLSRLFRRREIKEKTLAYAVSLTAVRVYEERA